MLQLIKIEMKRAWTRKATWIAFFIAFSISVIHVIHYILPYYSMMKSGAEQYKEMTMLYPPQVFENWIAGNTYNVEGFLYYMLMPILIALPVAGTFYDDRKEGLLVNVYTRCKRGTYLKSKYIASFLSAGIVFTLPLLLNLFMTASILPSLLPQRIMGTWINASKILYRLDETAPYMYVLVYMFINFIFAGVMSGLSLVLSHLTDKKLIVYIGPFIINIFIYSLCIMFDSPSAMDFTPVYFLQLSYGNSNIAILLCYAGVYFLLGCICFIWFGKREDLL